MISARIPLGCSATLAILAFIAFAVGVSWMAVVVWEAVT